MGFDDASRGKGRVDCRVFADGKEIYANPDLRADAPPVKLALPVAGAEQLRLHVDFGRGQDTGDRVIWANARCIARHGQPRRFRLRRHDRARRGAAGAHGCDSGSRSPTDATITPTKMEPRVHAHEQVPRSIAWRC